MTTHFLLDRCHVYPVGCINWKRQIEIIQLLCYYVLRNNKIYDVLIGWQLMHYRRFYTTFLMVFHLYVNMVCSVVFIVLWNHQVIVCVCCWCICFIGWRIFILLNFNKYVTSRKKIHAYNQMFYYMCYITKQSSILKWNGKINVF